MLLRTASSRQREDKYRTQSGFIKIYSKKSENTEICLSAVKIFLSAMENVLSQRY